MIAYHHVVDRDLANTQCHDLAQVRFKHQSIRCHLIPRQFLEERFHAHAAVYAAPSSTCMSGSGFLSMCYRLADGATMERHENNSHDHQNNSHEEQFPRLRDGTIVSGIALIEWVGGKGVRCAAHRHVIFEWCNYTWVRRLRCSAAGLCIGGLRTLGVNAQPLVLECSRGQERS